MIVANTDILASTYVKWTPRDTIDTILDRYRVIPYLVISFVAYINFFANP